MAETRIVNLTAFSSLLTPASLVKRYWRKNADIHIENGATKVVCLQAGNTKATQMCKFKFMSKGIWDFYKLRAFLDDVDTTRIVSNWTVSVKNLGNFITAATDFKDLKVATGGLEVELITSGFEKIVIGVRCEDIASDDCLFLRRSEAGDKLKLIVNEILCGDYENFIGYVLYKKLELNLKVVEEQGFFDWFVEVFMKEKGANGIIELLLNHVKELANDKNDVCFGIYKDTDCLPENIQNDKSFVNVDV